jgi:predicted dehydrogenase
VLWDLGAHLVDVALWCTGWSGTATVFAAGVRPGPVTVRPAGWYDSGGPPGPAPQIAYETVTGLVRVGDGSLHVRASWHGAVEADSVTVRVSGSAGVAELRTVFGFSPDRQTVPGPCLRVSDPQGGGWLDVLAEQPRQPLEYRLQLDEALRAGAADDLRAAVRSVALCEALARSLDDGRAVTTELSQEAT